MIEWMTQIDYSILLYIQEHLRFKILNGPMVFVSTLGNAAMIWILLCVFFLAFRRTRKYGICGIMALFFGALITNVALKNIVARIRPYDQFTDLVLLVKKQKDYSFPSGHSCSSIAVSTAFFMSSRDDRIFRKISAVCVILAVWICFSRLYVCVHFPSDVLAGMLIGYGCAVLACMVYRQFERKQNNV